MVAGRKGKGKRKNKRTITGNSKTNKLILPEKMQPTGVAFPKSNLCGLLFLLSSVKFCHNNNGFIWLTGFEKFPAAVSNYYNLMTV